MRPSQKKKNIAKTALLTLCALTAFHCSSDKSDDVAGTILSQEHASVSLQMNFVDTPVADSLVIDCYGVDTLHVVANPDSPYLDLDLFPGDNWKFQAKLYANGELMQTGELSTELEAGTYTEFSIQMHPIVGFVYVEIPIGFGNPAGIKSGELSIGNGNDKFTYPMTIKGATAIFQSGMLELGKEYTFSLSMQDENGEDIYSLSDTFLINEDSPVPELEIKSLRAKVNLAVQIAQEANKSISLTLPASRRAPKVGDMVISEVFSAPDTKDSAQFEFVEIYNGSLDTLNLSGCTIGTSSVSSKSWVISAKEIPPASALVLGNILDSKTPEKYHNTESWGTNGLTNATGSVVLQCSNSVLDSLYYADKTDSVHVNVVPSLGSNKSGMSAQLDISLYEDRKDSSSWSLAYPTPGTVTLGK